MEDETLSVERYNVTVEYARFSAEGESYYTATVLLYEDGTSDVENVKKHTEMFGARSVSSPCRNVEADLVDAARGMA
ncbi:MAG: hypothetical protein EPN91_03570 [Salinibacterium sp.]|nr:MAG: hypothetical protein EPN91_03570 [Salinibacterium sp.]